MPVTLHGHLDRDVAGEGHHIIDREALLDSQQLRKMPQVVQSHAHLDRLTQRFKVPSHHNRVIGERDIPGEQQEIEIALRARQFLLRQGNQHEGLRGCRTQALCRRGTHPFRFRPGEAWSFCVPGCWLSDRAASRSRSLPSARTCACMRSAGPPDVVCRPAVRQPVGSNRSDGQPLTQQQCTAVRSDRTTVETGLNSVALAGWEMDRIPG